MEKLGGDMKGAFSATSYPPAVNLRCFRCFEGGEMGAPTFVKSSPRGGPYLSASMDRGRVMHSAEM